MSRNPYPQFADAGVTFSLRTPPDSGSGKEYREKHDHQASDELDPSWDFAAALTRCTFARGRVYAARH